MSLYLRPAEPRDEKFVYELIYENLYDQLCAWAWDPATREKLMKIQIDGQRASYAAQYPQADNAIIVLYERPVGRLILDRGEQAHHLVDIVLKKESRSKGVGTWLLRAICMEAEMSRKPMRLYVQPNNRAKALYERLGFRMIEDHQVTLLMERPVGASAAVSLR